MNTEILKMLIYGNIVVNPESQEVTCRGKKVSLKLKEYQLLSLFLQYPDQVLTHDFITSQLWNLAQCPCHSTLRSHIKTLRKQLKKCSESDDIIQTVHGLGYRLKPLTEESSPELFPSISTLKKYLTTKGIEYLVLAQNYTIKFFSRQLVNYSDYPDQVQIGNYVGDAFPELIAWEENLEKVRNGEEQIFTLKGIGRAINPQRPEYINFYVIIGNNWENSSLEEKSVFVLVEDDSENLIIRQKLVQQLNKILLTQEQQNKTILS